MNEPQTPEYKTFKDKRQFWIECVSGKDPHAIRRQLTDMIWNAAAYRVVNEARRLASPAEDGGVELNGLMHRLIDKCFFESQMLAIRRLTDVYDLEGKRSVYALTALLKDMEKNTTLITRAHIFAAEGLAYDDKAVYDDLQQCRAERTMGGEKCWVEPNVLAWGQSARRHEQIDRLAGTSEQSRSLGDCVSSDVFVRLQKKLGDATSEVKKCVDKFVAHAATLESRSYARMQDIGLTLNHLWEAHKSLCQVTHFVNVVLLGDSMGPPLPTPQYDRFAYIDRPLVTTEKVAFLEKEWQKYSEETQQWTNWGLDAFEAECQ